jgi:hypothetical protein
VRVLTPPDTLDPPGAALDEQVRRLQNELTSTGIDLGIALGAAQLAVGHLPDCELKTRVGAMLAQVAAKRAGVMDVVNAALSEREQACGLLRRAADEITAYEVDARPLEPSEIVPAIGAFLARVAPG